MEHILEIRQVVTKTDIERALGKKIIRTYVYCIIFRTCLLIGQIINRRG